MSASSMSNKTEAGPVAWSVTFNGEHCGNLYPTQAEAEQARVERIATYGHAGARTVEPLYALYAHPPAQEQPAPADMTFCWLLELFLPNGGNSLGRYHTGFTNLHGGSRSTPDVYQARRYPTKEAAEAAGAKLGGTLQGVWHAVEHGFATHPTPAERAEQPQTEQELRELLARSVAGTALYADDGELQDASELPAIDFKRDTPGEISRKLTDRGLKKLTKADRVHALVNAGPYPGMSEAFDAHMGAACWTEPEYGPDAATWAAAWKAAKAHGA